MQPYERFTVWQKAHELVLRVHSASSGLVKGSHAHLVNQLRRSSTSISLNIVEGSARGTSAQFAHFLDIALGSARETAYLVRLLADMGLVEPAARAKLEARCDEVSRMLVGLQQTLRKPDRKAATKAKKSG